MTSKLLQIPPHEASNQTELSLREACTVLQDQLKPPFQLTIPTPSEYTQLNQALLYGILTQPNLSKIHFTHLNSIISDGYALFVDLLLKIVNESYSKVFESARVQLLWVSSKLVEVSALGVENLLISLLRQIDGGDFSHGNLWLSMELLNVFRSNWDWVVEEPTVLNGALYTYLRLLSDHYRMPGQILDVLKRSEVEFCVRVLREYFRLCMRIGRDLIRLLQDLVFIPEFRVIWKDLLSNPSVFGVPGFTDISQLYCARTSSRYFLLRITPEMETQVRFLLTHVKWGNQKRYQAWFARKFLCTPERETIICDLVRFICCAHHPPNEIIHSDIISRWAIIGWLLTCCRRNYIESNARLALFYDWLFFDERVDNIMNIEPAMLLMVNSIPRYINITHNLLDFLFLAMDNYDINRKDIIFHGVSASFDLLIRKGVICSLEPLISCNVLSPFFKERLMHISLNLKSKPSLRNPSDVVKQALIHPPNDAMPLKAKNSSDMEHGGFLFGQLEISRPYKRNGFNAKAIDDASQIIASSIASNSIISEKKHIGVIEKLVNNLGATLMQSKERGLQLLEKILHSFEEDFSFSPETLACNVTEAFKLICYEMFSPLEGSSNELDDDEVQSATALVIRTFIFSSHEKILEMISFWSKNGHAVGPRLLSYISRLAHEAQITIGSGNLVAHEHSNHNFGNPLNDDLEEEKIEKSSDKKLSSKKLLLQWHIDGHASFINSGRKDSPDNITLTPPIDFKLLGVLVEDAFAVYRSYLKLSCTKQSATFCGKSNEICPYQDQAKFLFSDLTSCIGWKTKRLKLFLHGIFRYLPDLSTGHENIIQLIVGSLDEADLVVVQIEVGLKRYSILGEDTKKICHLVKSSLEWDCVMQKKFWGLLISELTVSLVQEAKIFLDFCSSTIDPQLHPVAVEGLLTFFRSRSPTMELVGTIMSFPDKFGDFSAAVLASWAVSNGSIFFVSLSKWLQEAYPDFRNKNGGFVGSKSLAVGVNYFAVTGFSSFLDLSGLRNVDYSNSMPVNILEIMANFAKLANSLR